MLICSLLLYLISSMLFTLFFIFLFLIMLFFLFFFFFFSSRRRHTRLTCDWSSDVCSSDLHPGVLRGGGAGLQGGARQRHRAPGGVARLRGHVELDARGGGVHVIGEAERRSEERRVGKEWRSRGVADH